MTRKFSTAFFIVLALTACDETESEGTLSFRSTPPDEQLEDLFCPAKRQVAIKTNVGGCPSVDGWTTEPVFPGASDALQNFCKYEWGAASTPNVDALLEATDLAKVAPDCAAVFEQSNPVVWDEVGDDVEAAFHYGIGWASAADLSLSTTEASRWKVAVAVVDSVPEQAVTPRSVHGNMMADLINDIACPAGTAVCDVKVRRFLALPRWGEGQVDTQNGGYFGTQREVARAIYDAVQTWKTTNWGNEPAKLVISLSVGWNGTIYGDTDDPTPRPGVEAVHTAIKWAACHDAVVIAAAGNSDYTCLAEPLLPAAWNRELAPSATECEALFPQGTWANHGTRPLVYAVGGLQHDRGKMTYSIPNSMPPLAALATNAVADGNSMTITGTSAAAAVAAGAAALVLSYNPQLKAAQVMNLLYQHGGATPLDVEYPVPSNVEVRAVNACAALNAACDLQGANCPLQGDLACVNATAPVAMVDVFADIEAAATLSENGTVVGSLNDCPEECSAIYSNLNLPEPKAVFVGSQAPQECPEPMSLQQPFTLPQPLQIGCPNCTLDVTTNKVYASIDSAYQSHGIDDVTIGVLDAAGQTTYFRYGPMMLYVDAIKEIQLDSARITGGVRSASISITFNDNDPATVDRPVIDPLLLGPQ